MLSKNPASSATPNIHLKMPPGSKAAIIGGGTWHIPMCTGRASLMLCSSPWMAPKENSRWNSNRCCSALLDPSTVPCSPLGAAGQQTCDLLFLDQETHSSPQHTNEVHCAPRVVLRSPHILQPPPTELWWDPRKACQPTGHSPTATTRCSAWEKGKEAEENIATGVTSWAQMYLSVSIETYGSLTCLFQGRSRISEDINLLFNQFLLFATRLDQAKNFDNYDF